MDWDTAKLRHTPETLDLWEKFAVARQVSEDSLLSRDGLLAAQAYWKFIEAFRPQVEAATGPTRTRRIHA